VHEVLEGVGEAYRLESIRESDLADLLYVLKEVEKQAKDKALHGSDFEWLEEFCKVRTSDSDFLSDLRIHLRRELGVIEALEQIDRCKAMATYAKRSGVNSQLDERLKSPPKTRWNGKCSLLRSVLKFIDQVSEISAQLV